jgi:hypothetical protein
MSSVAFSLGESRALGVKPAGTLMPFHSMEEPRVAQLQIRLPFSPYAQIVALMGLAAIALSTFFVEGLKYSVPSSYRSCW